MFDDITKCPIGHWCSELNIIPHGLHFKRFYVLKTRVASYDNELFSTHARVSSRFSDEWDLSFHFPVETRNLCTIYRDASYSVTPPSPFVFDSVYVLHSRVLFPSYQITKNYNIIDPDVRRCSCK